MAGRRQRALRDHRYERLHRADARRDARSAACRDRDPPGPDRRPGRSGWLGGENAPSAITDTSDYPVPTHGETRGLPHVEIEIRQDLIADPAGQDGWAARLARLLPIA